MLLNNRLIHARQSDFTTAEKFTKLRPPSARGWYMTVLFILSLLFFHKNEKSSV